MSEKDSLLRESIGARMHAQREFANKIARETDGIIRAALNRKISEAWTLADLEGRLTAAPRTEGEHYDVLLIDGQPFLELHDLTMGSPEPYEPGAPHIITATRNYRFL